MDKYENMIFNILKVIYVFIFNPYHLWFVSSLIVAIIIEYFFLKKKKVEDCNNLKYSFIYYSTDRK